MPDPVQLTGRVTELFALLQRHPAGLTADGIREYLFAGYAFLAPSEWSACVSGAR